MKTSDGILDCRSFLPQPTLKSLVVGLKMTNAHIQVVAHCCGDFLSTILSFLPHKFLHHRGDSLMVIATAHSCCAKESGAFVNL